MHSKSLLKIRYLYRCAPKVLAVCATTLHLACDRASKQRVQLSWRPKKRRRYYVSDYNNNLPHYRFQDEGGLRGCATQQLVFGVAFVVPRHKVTSPVVSNVHPTPTLQNNESMRLDYVVLFSKSQLVSNMQGGEKSLKVLKRRVYDHVLRGHETDSGVSWWFSPHWPTISSRFRMIAKCSYMK